MSDGRWAMGEGIGLLMLIRVELWLLKMKGGRLADEKRLFDHTSKFSTQRNKRNYRYTTKRVKIRINVEILSHCLILTMYHD